VALIRGFSRRPISDLTPSPEIAWTPGDYNQVQPNDSTPFAQTFQTKGNYVIDGTKAPPQLGDILNAMCAGAQGTSCSFTPTGPLTWGIDWHELSSQGAADNIDCSAPPGASTDRGASVARQRTRVRIRGTEQPPGPPAGDPDWHEVSVTESRETSFSVGGSVSAGVEFELLHVIGTEVSVKFGVETEWSDMNDITKTIRIYLPPQLHRRRVDRSGSRQGHRHARGIDQRRHLHDQQFFVDQAGNEPESEDPTVRCLDQYTFIDHGRVADRAAKEM